MPAVINACVAEAHRLAALLAQPQSEDPALIGIRDELELMERLAARNPGNRAMAAAVQEQRQRIEAMQRTETPAVDADTARALQDPQFFKGATPQEQRLIFQALLQQVKVGAHGDPIAPLPRSS